MATFQSKNPDYEIIDASEVQDAPALDAGKINLTSKNPDYEILDENYVPNYNELPDLDKKKVKDIFFEQNPHIPKNAIGDMIFKLGAHLSSPPEKFKPRNDFEKRLYDAVQAHGDRVFGLPSNITGGAPETFGRTGVRSMIQGVADIANLVPGVPKLDAEEIIPTKSEEADSPIAGFLGEAVGYGAPAMAGVEGARLAIPLWNKIAEEAAPYLLKRLGVGAVEGGLSSAAVAKPGSRTEAGISGAVGIPILNEIIRAPFALVRSISKWWGAPDVGVLKQKLPFIEEAKEKAEEELKQTQSQSGMTFGKQTPESLQYDVNKDKQSIEEMKQRLSELDPTTKQNLLNTDEINQIEENSTRDLDFAKDNQKKAEQAIKSYLGEGEEHGVTLADTLLDTEESTKKEIGQQFNDLKSDLSKKNIKLTNPDEAFTIASDIRDLVHDGTFKGKDAKDAISEFDLAFGGKTGEIPADKFLTMLQTAKKLEFDAWKKGYDPNETADYRENWQEKAGALKAKIKKMEGAFENGVGSEDYSRYLTAKNRWRDEVIPLAKNSTFRSLKRSELAPTNLMEKIRGNEAGNTLIRDMIKRNPIAVRSLIGQKFASKPENLHLPNETLQEYTQNLPDLMFLKESHAQSMNNVEDAQKNLDYFRRKKPGLLSQRETQEKAITEKVSTQKRMSQIEAKLQDKEKMIKELTEKSNKRDITLKEWTSLKKQLDQAKKDRNDLIKLGAKIVAGIGGLTYAGYKGNQYRSGDF